jgi:inner membrane protein
MLPAMTDSFLNSWLYFGIFLIVAEFLLPGLVSVFVGLGALTVALVLFYNPETSVLIQLLIWFVSSTVYIFSLRLVVMKYYLSDQKKQNINEDDLVVGQMVQVVEKISEFKSGRIAYGESTWVAKTEDKKEMAIGEMVQVVRRDNITWWVKKIMIEESGEC